MPIVWLSTDLTQHTRMALPPQHHTARAPSQIRGYWARARLLWWGRHRERAWARLSLVMPMKLFEFEFEFETYTEVERERERPKDRPKQKSRWGRGKAWDLWKGMKKEREFERDSEGCVYVRKKENWCIECGLTKTKWGWVRKKSPFQHFGSIFFFLSLSLSCLLKGREEGKDLMVSNKGDLHKPGSGSRAAVVNEKAAASRQPY